MGDQTENPPLTARSAGGPGAREVRLPKLADTLVEGTITHWLKQPGDLVNAGEPLVEVETDKVNSELESPASGVLTEILAGEGTTVPVDEVIARITPPGVPAEPSSRGSVGETPPGGDTGAEPGGEQEPHSPGAGRAPSDTEALGSPTSETYVSSSGGLPLMRRRIAERMQEARATIDQGAVTLEIPVEELHPGAGWNACFVKALAEAGPYRDVGVAVEVEGGLVVPVLRDVPETTLQDLGEHLRDLARRAREGGLSPAEVQGGEITITNVGSTGTLLAFPLVSPGQPAILCPGRIEGGRLLLTLCYDRGAMDGEAAQRLLERVGASVREVAAPAA